MLRYPTDPKYPARVTFDVAGQHIHNIQLQGDWRVPFPGTTKEPGSGMATNKAKGKLMAYLGSALGQSNIKFYDMVFRFPKHQSIRGRAITELDVWLEGVQLVVLDASKWHSGALKCYHPRDDGGAVCGGDLKDNVRSFADNATSSKGCGEQGTHTVYLCSAIRSCQLCKKDCQDNLLLPQLPTRVASMVPIFRTEKSGVPHWAATIMATLIGEGLPFSQVAKALNAILQTAHAEQVSAW